MNLPADIDDRIRTAFASVSAQFPKGGNDQAWTKAVKLAIGDLGETLDFEVCAAGVQEERMTFQREWLFDLTWYEGSPGGFLSLPLILESEWGRDYEDIRHDFEKLMVGKSDYKIMVFQATGSRIAEYSGRLKKAIMTYQGSNRDETYLLVCLDEDELTFIIEKVKSAKELVLAANALQARSPSSARRMKRDVLLPLTQSRPALDLDDGVKMNYLKLGEALAPIPGLAAKEDE